MNNKKARARRAGSSIVECSEILARRIEGFFNWDGSLFDRVAWTGQVTIPVRVSLNIGLNLSNSGACFSLSCPRIDFVCAALIVLNNVEEGLLLVHSVSVCTVRF